jgi:putative methylase
MKYKELAEQLSKLKDLPSPKVSLEQYTTPVGNVIELLDIANSRGDIRGKIVGDLGCGNGIIGIGALLLGAKKVYFYDIDENALEITEENLRKFDFSILKYDVIKEGIFSIKNKFDTVLSNPPFGYRSAFQLELFLQKLNEITNRFYIIINKNRENAALIRKYKLNAFESKIKLKKTMKFHKETVHQLPIYIVYN